MSRKTERNRIVSEAMNGIRAIMEVGLSVENLERSKARLIELAAQKHLFTFEDFPLPDDDAMECSYLIHEYEDGSYALYVNSGAPHQYYAPHDHGDAWAIIAGVRGRRDCARVHPCQPSFRKPVIARSEVTWQSR